MVTRSADIPPFKGLSKKCNSLTDAGLNPGRSIRWWRKKILIAPCMGEHGIKYCSLGSRNEKTFFHYNFNFKVLFLSIVFHAFKDIRVLEWVACISAYIGTFWISSIVVKFSPFSATDVLWQLACHRRCWWCWHWPRLVKALRDIVAALFQFTVRKSSGARMPTGSTRRTTRSSRCWSSCWRPARTHSSSAWPRSTSENTSATIRAENSEFKKSSHLLWIAPRSCS